MVEGIETWDLVPNVDLKAYAAWSKKATEAVLKAPGLIEFRAYRGFMAPAQVRVASDWQSMADWAKFFEGPWQQLEAELRAYATNLRYELWGPSPINPEPLRPGK
jgi:heme-degrading monooxygenase HmoA